MSNNSALKRRRLSKARRRHQEKPISIRREAALSRGNKGASTVMPDEAGRPR